MHGLLNYSTYLLLIVLYFNEVQARRYRTCDEGCCVYEYCAYHRICYPKIHCRFGCPDGRCVGQDTPTSSEDMDSHTGVSPTLGAAGTQLSHIAKERYPPVKESGDLRRGGDGGGFQFSDKAAKRYDAESTGALLPPMTDAVGGICMPDPPCKPTDRCGMAHSCSMNFNLGYRTCQYNLDIGSTLCFDSKGNLNMKHMD